MGQKCTKQEDYDPNKVVSKEEYEENVKNFNQFVRQHSQRDLRQIEDQQMAQSIYTDVKRQSEYENGEGNDNRNDVSNYNQQIGNKEGAVSKIYQNGVSDEFTISDWITLIIKDMGEAGFDGSEYEIHHTEVSIKLILLFTAMNYKKIDAFIELNSSLWMEYVMLEIQYHMFDKVGIARICNNIQRLYHLQYLILDFSHNKIAMNNECISKCVSNLPDLKIFTLNIEGNNIGEEGIRLISKSLSNLKFLNQLNLNLKWNKVYDSGLIYISDIIAQMRFISQLTIDVSGNKLTEKGVSLLFESISIIGKLQQLSIDISHNDINFEGGISLADCIKSQENLVELTLYLNGNNLTQEGAYPILESFQQLYNLVKLDLDISFNNIPIFDAKQIRDSLHQFTHIKKKDLRFF